MQWNGQLILLERYLVMKFGSGIKIVNYDFSLKQTLGYVCPDERNAFGYNAEGFDNPIGFGADQGFISAPGFRVEVPSAIIFDINEMRANIDVRQIGASEYEIIIV
jgi:hypothetical protein